VNETNGVLLALADRLAAAYVAHTRPSAILLVRPIAAGLTDAYSDVDLIGSHDEPPSQKQLDAVRQQVDSAAYTLRCRARRCRR
jgi:hypothetical protein